MPALAVLVDGAFASSAGLEQYVRIIAKGIADSDLCERTVFVCSSDERARRLPAILGRDIGAERIVSSGLDPRVMKYVRSAGVPFRGRRVGVAHSPTALRFRSTGARSVVTVPDVLAGAHPEMLVLRQRLGLAPWIERRAIETADVLIAISEATAEGLRAVYPDATPDVRVTPLGVDHAVFHPRGSMLGADDQQRLGVTGEDFLLYVGSLYERKIGNLIDAYAAARAVDAGIPSLVVVGGRPSYTRGAEPIEAKLSRLDLTNHVTLLGRIDTDDIALLMSACTAFVYPSHYEGFGLTVLEALACGAPVVTSSTSSLPEVVGDAALLVDPDDVQQLSNAIVEVATSPDLRGQLRERALRRAASFSWDRTVSQTLRLYRDLLDG